MTHPVGTKKPNAFGLYDIHGNVSQWVEDCYHDSYQGAPSDGSAWVGQCIREERGANLPAGRAGVTRVIRGGSWLDDPDFLRAASHFRYGTVFRGGILGFRVGRTLTL